MLKFTSENQEDGVSFHSFILYICLQGYDLSCISLCNGCSLIFRNMGVTLYLDYCWHKGSCASYWKFEVIIMLIRVHFNVSKLDTQRQIFGEAKKKKIHQKQQKKLKIQSPVLPPAFPSSTLSDLGLSINHDETYTYI